MRFLLLVGLALAGCGTPPQDDCRALERALCARSTSCDATDTETACERRADEELVCADVVISTGDVAACISDVGSLVCADLDAKRLPPSCDDVTFK